MLLFGVKEFLSTNWLWLSLGLLVVICIIVLLCTGNKDKGAKQEDEKKELGGSEPETGEKAEPEAAPASEPIPDQPVFDVIEDAKEPEAPAPEREPEPETEAFRAEETQEAPAPLPEAVPEPEDARPEERAAFAEPEEAPAEAYRAEVAVESELKPESEPESIDEEDHADVVVKHTDAEKKSTGGYRVVYDRETFTWVVKKDNNTRVTRRVKTKKEALEIAKELCKKQDTSMTVHKKDGKFQKK